MELVLDLQAMEAPTHGCGGHGGGSHLSVSGCGGASGLSLLLCEV
ncbi:hypothetical protein GCM10010174_54000 [Kutzneria viridogrisea]|uniref:Uncharacterized protein n=2 Tax=Kutzneria TaxID=43356 RepID=W5W1G3_9PSEU|nr:SapB/AmfS family lanthipeptide [Kutzneria albida]AHH94652.1 hypothetical protein KALB_1279 [Kutzneria albida DSM 43870]MBA8930320.1 hypothetical protein [Kutzneria viridogrisea]